MFRIWIDLITRDVVTLRPDSGRFQAARIQPSVQPPAKFHNANVRRLQYLDYTASWWLMNWKGSKNIGHRTRRFADSLLPSTAWNLTLQIRVSQTHGPTKKFLLLRFHLQGQCDLNSSPWIEWVIQYGEQGTRTHLFYRPEYPEEVETREFLQVFLLPRWVLQQSCQQLWVLGYIFKPLRCAVTSPTQLSFISQADIWKNTSGGFLLTHP